MSTYLRRAAVYFFYIDESGSRDPAPTHQRPDGSTTPSEHIYVLTAVALYERRWRAFEQEITDLKSELLKEVNRACHLNLRLEDCEVKSNWLRNPKERKERSPFLNSLDEPTRLRLVETFYKQLEHHSMRVFSVVIDKRKLWSHMTSELLHKKAYELLLERIERYMWECQNKHQAVIVMDDTQRQLNRAIAFQHGRLIRFGNQVLRFKHLVEFPFFTESTLSNGVQLADLCAYNVLRAFRTENFTYPYFERLLPAVYNSRNTASAKMDGIKVFPEDSELADFWKEACRAWIEKQPAP